MGILDLARICCDSATAFHAAKNRRSGNNHDPLPVRIGCLPGVVHPKLDLAILRRKPLLGSYPCDRGRHPDSALLGLLLDLLHKVCIVTHLASWLVLHMANTTRRILQGKRFNLPV